MTWALNLLLAALRGVWKLSATVLAPVRRWLLRDFRHAVILGLAVALAWHWLVIGPRLRTDLASEKAAHLETKQAWEQDIGNFLAAVAEAGRFDAANAERVRSEQDAINRRIADDYEARLRALRARAAAAAAGGVRHIVESPTAASGGAGAAVPGLPDAAGRSGEAPDPAGFPLAAAVIASEQALQLDALISWVEQQAAVDVNGGGR